MGKINIEKLNTVLSILKNDNKNYTLIKNIYLCKVYSTIYASINYRDVFLFLKLANEDNNINFGVVLDVNDIRWRDYLDLYYDEWIITISGINYPKIEKFPNPCIELKSMCKFKSKLFPPNIFDLTQRDGIKDASLVIEDNKLTITTLSDTKGVRLKFICDKVTYDESTYDNGYLIKRSDIEVASKYFGDNQIEVFNTNQNVLMLMINNDLLISCRKSKSTIYPKSFSKPFEFDEKINNNWNIYNIIDDINYKHQEISSNEDINVKKILKISIKDCEISELKDFNEVNPEEYIYIDLNVFKDLKYQRVSNAADIKLSHNIFKIEEKNFDLIFLLCNTDRLKNLSL